MAAFEVKKIYLTKNPCQNQSCAVALGSFDGIHIGHRALLAKTVTEAKKCDLVPSVFTISDSESYKNMPYLASPGEKYLRIKQCGVEEVNEVCFSNIRTLSPLSFVQDILVGTCRAKLALCGEHFRFGENALGDCDTLQKLMRDFGGDAVVVPRVLFAGEPVSSSMIRRALVAGEIEKANELLGEPYTVSGEVVHGQQIGRSLAFPTVNQTFPPEYLIPKRGVYISETKIDQKIYRSVSNIGVRPTVSENGTVNCETHILGEVGALYGKEISVSLLRYLRPEIKFADRTQLSAQIALDRKAAFSYQK